jgi:hypothetical protein
MASWHEETTHYPAGSIELSNRCSLSTRRTVRQTDDGHGYDVRLKSFSNRSNSGYYIYSIQEKATGMPANSLVVPVSSLERDPPKT